VAPEPSQYQAGQLDLAGFLKDREPVVVVYDLAPPYAESWRALQAVASGERGKERYFILTTANKAAVEQALGPTEALEIGAEPSGHHELVRTVRRTLEARAEGTSPQ
jgi:hypothetical protein